MAYPGRKMCRSSNPRDAVQGLPLHLPRERRRETVEVVFVRRAPFGFEKELVLLLVGEGAKLVLDRGTVTGSDALDRAVEERRAVEAAAQRVVHFGRGVDQKAWKLVANGRRIGRKREFRRIRVAVLGLQRFEIDGSRIESGRGAGLHAADFEACRTQIFGDSVRCGIARATSFGLLRAAVHHPVEEGSGRKDDASAREFDPHAGAYAPDSGAGSRPCGGGGLPVGLPCRHTVRRAGRRTAGYLRCCGMIAPVARCLCGCRVRRPGRRVEGLRRRGRMLRCFEQQLRGGILPDVEVRGVLQRMAPLLRETGFVALRAGAPHGGSLRAVEHPELDGRAVGDAAHLPA